MFIIRVKGKPFSFIQCLHACKSSWLQQSSKPGTATDHNLPDRIWGRRSCSFLANLDYVGIVVLAGILSVSPRTDFVLVELLSVIGPLHDPSPWRFQRFYGHVFRVVAVRGDLVVESFAVKPNPGQVPTATLTLQRPAANGYLAMCNCPIPSAARLRGTLCGWP